MWNWKGKNSRPARLALWASPSPSVWMLASLSISGLGFPAAFLSGCSSQVRLAPQARESAPWSAPRGRSWAQAESLFQLRADIRQAIAAEAAFADAAQEQADIPELLTHWSHACYVVGLYADLEVEQRRGYFRRGTEIGKHAMTLHPGFGRLYAETADMGEAARALSGPYLESAFWVAANQGRLLNESDRYIRRGGVSEVAELVQYLLKAADTLYFAGPHRLAGAMALRLPEGDREKGRRHLEKARGLAPDFLGNSIVFAEFYATATGDKRLFTEVLAGVDKTPSHGMAANLPENHLERRRALSLLRQADKLFPDQSTQAEP